MKTETQLHWASVWDTGPSSTSGGDSATWNTWKKWSRGLRWRDVSHRRQVLNINRRSQVEFPQLPQSPGKTQLGGCPFYFPSKNGIPNTSSKAPDLKTNVYYKQTESSLDSAVSSPAAIQTEIIKDPKHVIGSFCFLCDYIVFMLCLTRWWLHHGLWELVQDTFYIINE